LWVGHPKQEQRLNTSTPGIVVDYEIEAGMPPDAPRLAPAIARAITATGVVPGAGIVIGK
jgi:hypothetical protein